jgi:CubicO group peptidase (beta-lactamase class C family)
MSAALIRLVALSSALVLLHFTAELAFAAEPSPDCGNPSDIHDQWVIGSPEQQGFDPAVLCAMGKGVLDGKLANVDSIVIVRHGVLVYEHYFDYLDPVTFDAAHKHVSNSMTKSVVSLLVGIAMDRGLIKDLDASIFSYFPEYADLRTPEKDRITLRNLLTMSSGLHSSHSEQMFLRHDHDPHRRALEMTLVSDPGTSFEYYSLGTELIGAILQKVSGKPVDILAQENIFAPLGIDDIDWYGRLGNGVPMSSTGLRLSPRDWAKIGQLVLNHGMWQGKQIVPASWIAQSTTEQLKARKPYSYGFQWWIGRSLHEGHSVEWMAAFGFNGQKTIIIPELDTVVVFNASLESAQMAAPEIELLDKYILPATVNH